MPVRRTIAITLLLLVLGGGCSLLSDDAQASPACGRALDRATQVAADRTRVVDRTHAVTEMDPVRIAAVLDHRDEVQRAVFGPIAEVANRADTRATTYERLRGQCRQGADQVPDRCRDTFTQADRLQRTAGQALQTRMAFWSTQVHMAQRATAGDAPGTRQAVARWGDLLSTYEHRLIRMDRVNGRLQRATLGCRDEL